MSGVNGTNHHSPNVNLNQSQISPNQTGVNPNQVGTPATSPSQQTGNTTSTAFTQTQGAQFQQLTSTTGQNAQQATFPSPQNYWGSNQTGGANSFSADPSLNPMNENTNSNLAALLQQEQNRATLDDLIRSSPELQQAMNDPSLSPAMKALIKRLFITVIISRDKMNRDVDAVANLDGDPNQTDQTLATTFLGKDTREYARNTDQASNILDLFNKTQKNIANNTKN